ncbi:DNA ligase [Colwellia sp. E2M01]|uniref:DNA ligase n=1 Tax=Colwellia sp. E2M01 TaxID=2841561 RepID=UPI001C092ABA|nr:DNA ligase [Colwellia sp. E2M01]MBU2870177.1 DNA ligase [Colwellia sp. E2M01]
MKKSFLLILFIITAALSWSLTATISIQNTNTSNLHNNQNEAPSIQHGVDYQSVDDISLYFISEKLDGVRGYWDGEKLITRQGNIINSPTWFTKNWPTQAIDGELWIARGKFQHLMSCISRHQADENQTTSCWQNVRFMMFDLPESITHFSERVKQMQTLLKTVPSFYLGMVNQIRLNDTDELEVKLAEVIDSNGEGLMLHHANAYYKEGRNSALMKLKKHQDAEAIVIAHTQGKGKYTGLLGALEVQTAEGVIFKIGSGFSDNERANPPKIGTLITFKYNGLTDAGIPRFARFWRVRTTE